jgi:hypothetical protein
LSLLSQDCLGGSDGAAWPAAVLIAVGFAEGLTTGVLS